MHIAQPYLPRACPSLQDWTQFRTQGRGSGGAGATRLLVVKRCSVCPTLCWVRISPVLWWGQKSRPCPPRGRPWEGCMREGCSPFGDAAPFPSALLRTPPALVSLSALLWQRLPASQPKQFSYREQQLPSTRLLSPSPGQPLRSAPSRTHGPHGGDRTGHLSHPTQPQGAALRDPRSISLKPGRGCGAGGGMQPPRLGSQLRREGPWVSGAERLSPRERKARCLAEDGD